MLPTKKPSFPKINKFGREGAPFMAVDKGAPFRENCMLICVSSAFPAPHGGAVRHYLNNPMEEHHDQR